MGHKNAMQEWQLQEAKNGFSQLIKQATAGEPQLVTVHGKPAAVVMSAEEYARLTRSPRSKLSAALLQSELAADELFAQLAQDRKAGDGAREFGL